MNTLQNNSENILNSRVTAESEYQNEIELSEIIWKEERNIMELKKLIRCYNNESEVIIILIDLLINFS